MRATLFGSIGVIAIMIVLIIIQADELKKNPLVYAWTLI